MKRQGIEMRVTCGSRKNLRYTGAHQLMPAQVQAGKPRIDLSRYELSLDGRRVRLEHQPMELLILLVERKGQLVTREDIVGKLWGKDVFVDVDQSINAAVRKIRFALKDNPAQPRYLETVVGKGYRFIGDMEVVGSPCALPERVRQPDVRESVMAHSSWTVRRTSSRGCALVGKQLRRRSERRPGNAGCRGARCCRTDSAASDR